MKSCKFLIWCCFEVFLLWNDSSGWQARTNFAKERWHTILFYEIVFASQESFLKKCSPWRTDDKHQVRLILLLLLIVLFPPRIFLKATSPEKCSFPPFKYFLVAKNPKFLHVAKIFFWRCKYGKEWGDTFSNLMHKWKLQYTTQIV